ncbi:conjugative relaxase-like TrwC/TraI family protein [Desulfomicrobium macestii]|uniref:Conjugative relaxase-like TrwC/TraI family protein n=1 Tax=Desulfomicrobium macestii TaxID=90731 RepID=A0ABR9H8J1_9BACT|nr:MobF family relaxase [Desulfomicrobium macestii]MBE1427015.1 conjugative relaxase-like TrwC/TraI family protein [Desulfomicrobium macestii]
MLEFKSIGAGDDAQGIADYYTDLAREDYYTHGGEPAGKWIGRGAERFGYCGETVGKADLYFAFEGYNHKYGNAIANNAGDKHKAGYDLTFSAPKSVSIVWATADEKTRKALSEAQQKAVEKAITYAEKSGAFIQREGHAGAIKTPYLDGVAVATFEHSTSRNLDPNLHTHAVVCNLAPNGKRIDFQASYVKELGAVYRAELALELREMGFAIERDRFSFSISEVPEELKKELSSRRAEIEKALNEKGLHSSKGAEVATLSTRQKKTEVDRSLLFENAKSAAVNHGFDPSACYGKTSLEWTKEDFLRDSFDHASTMTETRLKAALMESAQGVFDSKEALKKCQEMEQSGDLIRLQGPDGRVRYTSKEMFELEKDLVDRAESLSKNTWHTVSKDTLSVVYSTKTMADEQKKALEHIVADNRLAVVRGVAGAGKSYMLDGAREAWERTGIRVLGCAPSADAAKNLQESANIQSLTSHKLLSQIEFGQLKLDKKTVVVMDEAGMTGSRIMAQLVNKVDHAGAKLVLIGDTGQLQPVDPGAAMRSIQTKIGCEEMVEIRRQHNDVDRQIVRHLADGQAEKAVALMDERGQIHVHKDQSAIRETVANAVVADIVAGKSSLAMAGMNREVRQINDLVHAKLQENGLVAKDEKPFVTAYGDRGFAAGDRVLFRKNDYKAGLLNGQRATVLSSKENTLTVKLDGSDQVRTVTADDYKHLDFAYAVTVHKSQGATVDRAHYALDPSMVDSNLGYVAGSRHRESFAMHCTTEDRENLEKLLTRDREKDTSADYRREEKAPEVAQKSPALIEFEAQMARYKEMLAQQAAARERTAQAIARDREAAQEYSM